MSDTRQIPTPGEAVTLEPGLRRVLAPNPSPMTLFGTNTYLLGEGAVAVIDPGPALPQHQAAILAALHPGERISHILVTHSHLDHSPLARDLSQATGAPVLGFGPSDAGRSPVMQALAEGGLAGGGEGVDAAFRPDVEMPDGASVEGAGWRLDALHTPGHFGNHLCFRWGRRVFSGDHVMGWASSLVSPPDGDMGAYMASLERLAAAGPSRLYPGHGAPVADPAARIAELAAHRRARERQLLDALAAAPADAATLTRAIYTDTPPALLPAAARNVFAHLIDLWQRGLVACHQAPAFSHQFRRI